MNILWNEISILQAKISFAGWQLTIKGSDDGLSTKLKLGTGELVYLLCKTVFFSITFE